MIELPPKTDKEMLVNALLKGFTPKFEGALCISCWHSCIRLSMAMGIQYVPCSIGIY